MPDLKPLQLNPPLNVTIVRDQAGLDKLSDFFQRTKGGDLGYDIETNPLKDFFYRRARTWQFGTQAEQYVIDLRAFCGDSADALFKAQGFYGLNIPDSLKPVIDLCRPVLCGTEWRKVGVNLSFEYQNAYWQFGLRIQNLYDCAMAERCIWAGALGSMKQYAFFSMEGMMARYFQVQIDKTLQQSFDLDCDLTPAQLDYACLDTRLPIAIKAIQALILQGETPTSLRKKGMTSGARYLESLDPIILGDDLREIAQIENNAIGAFEDMHVHGERLDRPHWMERVARKRVELKKVIADELDPIFLPIVGDKNDQASEEEVAAAEADWKALNTVSPEELILRGDIRKQEHLIKKGGADACQVVALRQQLDALATVRKAHKDELKAICSELKKKRTKIKNLTAKCAGNALINYESGAQLLNVLRGIKGLKSLDDTEDDTLEKYEHIPVMAALRKYRTLAKDVGTYGDAWATEWATKPCKDEGWLHPGDGRLHCVFNQYDAETGRSSSEKPNGQNLPKDKEVRACFIVDEPDESIRISDCCEADTTPVNAHNAELLGLCVCTVCHTVCKTHAEEYVMVTADMSGAELRIIAELADDPVWIGAFARGEDVHSVGTEIMYAEKWPTLALLDCAYYHINTADDIAERPLRILGEPKRQKCKCPDHNQLRDDNKSTNFLLAYGGGPHTLAKRIKKTVDACRDLMALHAAKFPNIWSYLTRSGQMAKLLKKAFDMFGRRRLFIEPTWERAKDKAKDDREKKLRFSDEEQDRNIANFIQFHGRKPKGGLAEIDSEHYNLTHREPSNKEIGNAFQALHGIIERAGKNHAIQGTNATIAKLAMGSGYDSIQHKPYLWHTLPQYKAKLIKFVHDELVVQCPKRYGKQVAALIGDAFKRAAAEKMKKVVMEFDFNIASYWKK